MRGDRDDVLFRLDRERRRSWDSIGDRVGWRAVDALEQLAGVPLLARCRAALQVIHQELGMSADERLDLLALAIFSGPVDVDQAAEREHRRAAREEFEARVLDLHAQGYRAPTIRRMLGLASTNKV